MTLEEKLTRANSIDNNINALVDSEKKKLKDVWYKPSKEENELTEAAVNARIAFEYYHNLLRRQAQKKP
jgi:hypothetical protein